MPLLDYRCNTCGHKFDELVYSHNQDKVRCPQCGGKELARVYEGKCLFGSLGGGGRSAGGCNGKSCAGCAGCGH